MCQNYKRPDRTKLSFSLKRILIYRDEKTVILHRWNLITCKWFVLQVHKSVSSDHDCLHDHPWDFISFIIKGGYVEKTENGLFYKKPLSFLYRKAEWKHSVQLLW